MAYCDQLPFTAIWRNFFKKGGGVTGTLTKLLVAIVCIVALLMLSGEMDDKYKF